MAELPFVEQTSHDTKFHAEKIARHTNQVAGEVNNLQERVESAENTISSLSSNDSNNLSFTQTTAATVWTIIHNLGRNPSVTIKDTAGDRIIADVVYDDDDSLTINFNVAIAGTAYLV